MSRFPDNALGLGPFDDEYEHDPSSPYGGISNSRYPPMATLPSISSRRSLGSLSRSSSHQEYPMEQQNTQYAQYAAQYGGNQAQPQPGTGQFSSQLQHSPEDYARQQPPHQLDQPDPPAPQGGQGGEFGQHQYPSYGNLNDPNLESGHAGSEKEAAPASKKKMVWIIVGLIVAVAIIGGVVGGVLGSRKSSNGDSASAGAGSGSGDGNGNGNGDGSSNGNGKNTASEQPLPDLPKVRGGSGGVGSEVTTDLGVTFTYVNDFGGSWAFDEENPFSVSGQAQSWTPKLTEEWTWGRDIVRGVNLGGWLVTEPFIVPALYEEYQDSTPQAIDEYTLSQAMGKDLSSKMGEHYKTFITEKDFADIAAAGLNWIRIPIGYWAISVQDDEPFLPKVSWLYFVKAVAWARKYGLRVQVDFHALPGSQNGWNHSGKAGGVVGWMAGIMGIVNAERHLDNIRSVAQYISQDGIKQVVPMIGLVNEVQTIKVPQDALGSFYRQAYETIRTVSGFGNGAGPIIAMHEAFLGIAGWKGFLAGADRVALDQHPYLAFGGPNTRPWASQIEEACSWGGGTNDTQRDFGIVVGGEWSNAINDCGLWLNGVGSTPAYEGHDGTATCKTFDEWMHWDDEMKQNVMGYTMANMDALQNFFFWTWHIGNSTVLGYPSTPLWHYKLGLEQGWMPKDPRAAGGYCKRQNFCPGCYEFDGNFPATATGAVPSPTVAADQVEKYPWPPASILPEWIGTRVSVLPSLVQTGTPLTLPVPTESAFLSGWANNNDNVGAWVTAAGCPYLGAYDGNVQSAMPTAACTGTSA